jgi:surface carbohydrate biosynthesis protein
MYHQVFEIAGLKPDFVLMNYLRDHNRELVKAYSECGILVGVLDTEGGVFHSVESDLTNVVARNEPSNIDLYCLWGKRQYDSFVTHEVMPEDKLHLTGCPRYDFCVEPWRSALPYLPETGEAMILVNTRFSLTFPRYQRGLKDEINIMLGAGFEDGYVRRYVRQCFLVWAEMVNVVADLAQSFSKVTFIVRPHPFEDEKIYEQVFQDVPNVKVVREGSVLPWIKSCLLLIQRDCSTAIEACFLGVEPVSLGWIDADLLNNEVISTVSHHAKSRKELFSIVESALSGSPFSATAKKKEQRRSVVRDWFHAIDGRSSERVADAIMTTLDKGMGKDSRGNSARILLYNRSLKERFKGLANFIGSRFFGTHGYDRLKSGILRKPGTISKEFTVKDVKAIVSRISKVVSDSRIVNVERVCFKDRNFKLVARYSIKMSV